MTINLAAYGYGLGLVMAGYLAGLVVSQFFAVVRSVSHLG
jgi:hypothetical protein